MSNLMLIYPGSFNPLHAGHLAIAHWAEQRFETEVWFDVAKFAYDKEEIDETEYKARCRQFYNLNRKTCNTGKTTFIEKEKWLRTYERWPNSEIYFLVGIDTLERIINAQYYFGSAIERDRVLKLYNEKTKFIVFPRNNKKFSDIDFMPLVKKLCIEAEGFEEVYISSTEIRYNESTQN